MTDQINKADWFKQTQAAKAEVDRLGVDLEDLQSELIDSEAFVDEDLRKIAHQQKFIIGAYVIDCLSHKNTQSGKTALQMVKSGLDGFLQKPSHREPFEGWLIPASNKPVAHHGKSPRLIADERRLDKAQKRLEIACNASPAIREKVKTKTAQAIARLQRTKTLTAITSRSIEDTRKYRLGAFVTHCVEINGPTGDAACYMLANGFDDYVTKPEHRQLFAGWFLPPAPQPAVLP